VAFGSLWIIFIVFCSVDALGLPSDILNIIMPFILEGPNNGITMYIQPDDILLKMRNKKASKKAIYLNNDHSMLKNGLH
jgi:hypothetical protein